VADITAGLAEQFVRALRHFILRDSIFLAGGGSVVLSFLHTFGPMPSPTDHFTVFLLLAGISYVVGYALQDAICLLPWFTTAPAKMNRRLAEKRFSRLYRLYTGDLWQEIPNDFDFESAEEQLNQAQTIWLDRITVLQQVSTTFIPCCFLSSCLLFYDAYKGSDGFSAPLATAAFLLGVILVPLGRLKIAQQAQYLFRHGGNRVS